MIPTEKRPKTSANVSLQCDAWLQSLCILEGQEFHEYSDYCAFITLSNDHIFEQTEFHLVWSTQLWSKAISGLHQQYWKLLYKLQCEWAWDVNEMGSLLLIWYVEDMVSDECLY